MRRVGDVKKKLIAKKDNESKYYYNFVFSMVSPPLRHQVLG